MDTERIQDQIRRAHDGHAWHGSSIKELLSGVTAAQAAERPVKNAHTIWELVRHMMVWRAVVCRRIGGDPVRSLTPARDWPAIGRSTDAAWAATLADFEQSQRQLLETVGRISDARLADMVPEHPYTFYVMLHGVVQHDVYHAGQIALLKKALGRPARSTPRRARSARRSKTRRPQHHARS